ncbi:MAG: sialidase family protein [Armatimonadota bacterium]
MSAPGYDLQLDAIRSGYDGETCWTQARAGVIPEGGEDMQPAVVVTMQKLLLSASDVFWGLNEMRTDDMGQTWRGPVKHGTLARRDEPEGIEVVFNDAEPMWHAHTGKLLATGHCARYIGDKLMPDPRPRQVSYAVYNARDRAWEPWKTLDMPDEERFFSAGSGSAQRVDLPDGTILLPVYYRPPTDDSWSTCAYSSVIHCDFDGHELRFLQIGDELTVPEPRGLCEPSLTWFQGRYYLTMRNDERGYVSAGDDGLRFSDPEPWRFDDGEELGSYNTQQHWITHSDALYLVYTRRGLDNDHVMRNRAPLVMAQVDPDSLRVIRETEKIMVPERGARLGNFSTTTVNADESWIIAAEWMQPAGCEKHGSDNTVWAARIKWHEPNRILDGEDPRPA